MNGVSDIAALIREAEEEIHIFDRPSVKTGKRLIEALKCCKKSNI